jgi:hypothetical protein
MPRPLSAEPADAERARRTAELEAVRARCLDRGDLEHAAIVGVELAAALRGPAKTRQPPAVYTSRLKRVAHEYKFSPTGMCVGRRAPSPVTIRRPRQACGGRRRPRARGIARAHAPPSGGDADPGGDEPAGEPFGGRPGQQQHLVGASGRERFAAFRRLPEATRAKAWRELRRDVEARERPARSEVVAG